MAGRTVLLAWELGGGFGHVRRLAAVGRALAADGHRVVLANRDLVGPWAALAELPWPLVTSPYFNAPLPAGAPPFRAGSFADILGQHGYSSADTLAPLVRGWDGLLAAVRPAVVVADFAPTLVLAARGRVPVVDVTNGFQPPADLPAFPLYGPDRPPLYAEPDLLAVVRAVQRGRGGPEPDTLPGVLAASARLVGSPAELDPFREFRPGTAVGVFEADTMDPMPLPAEPRFFAYLNGAAGGTGAVLSLLAGAGYRGSAYLRGGPPGLAARLRAAGVEVFDRLQVVADQLARARVVVHHASLGVAAMALAAGRPQLVFPEHFEQMLTAAALYRLGVAHSLAGEFPAADVAEGMRQLMHDPGFAGRSAEVAAGMHRDRKDGLGAVLAACRDYLF